MLADEAVGNVGRSKQRCGLKEVVGRRTRSPAPSDEVRVCEGPKEVTFTVRFLHVQWCVRGEMGAGISPATMRLYLFPRVSQHQRPAECLAPPPPSLDPEPGDRLLPGKSAKTRCLTCCPPRDCSCRRIRPQNMYTSRVTERARQSILQYQKISTAERCGRVSAPTCLRGQLWP